MTARGAVMRAVTGKAGLECGITRERGMDASILLLVRIVSCGNFIPAILCVCMQIAGIKFHPKVRNHGEGPY